MWYPSDLLGQFSHVSKGVIPWSFPAPSLLHSVYKMKHTSFKWNDFAPIQYRFNKLPGYREKKKQPGEEQVSSFHAI